MATAVSGAGSVEHSPDLGASVFADSTNRPEKAYQNRDHYMVYCKVWPHFDPLRSDPRFQDLLRRMNFPN